MQLCPPCKTFRSRQFCICKPGLCKKPVSERVHVLNLRMQHEYSRILWLHRIPTAEHFPFHSWHTLLLVKKCQTCSVDQGRLIYCMDGFALGGHNCTCKSVRKCVRTDTIAICSSVRADTIALCSSVRADTIAYAKVSGEHYRICDNVCWIILHRGHNCMRHRLGTFFRFLTRNSTSKSSRSANFSDLGWKMFTWFYGSQWYRTDYWRHFISWDWLNHPNY